MKRGDPAPSTGYGATQRPVAVSSPLLPKSATKAEGLPWGCLGAEMCCPMLGYPLPAPGLALARVGGPCSGHVLGGCLVAVGGMDGNDPFALLSAFQMTASLSTGRWSLCSPTALRRSKVRLVHHRRGSELEASAFPAPQLHPLLPPLQPPPAWVAVPLSSGRDEGSRL